MGSKYFKSILVYEDGVHECVLNTLFLFRLIFAARKDSFVHCFFSIFILIHRLIYFKTNFRFINLKRNMKILLVIEQIIVIKLTISDQCLESRMKQ